MLAVKDKSNIVFISNSYFRKRELDQFFGVLADINSKINKVVSMAISNFLLEHTKNISYRMYIMILGKCRKILVEIFDMKSMGYLQLYNREQRKYDATQVIILAVEITMPVAGRTIHVKREFLAMIFLLF